LTKKAGLYNIRVTVRLQNSNYIKDSYRSISRRLLVVDDLIITQNTKMNM